MSLRKHSAVKIAHWLADGAEKARVAGDVAASLELAMKAAEYLQLARDVENRPRRHHRTGEPQMKSDLIDIDVECTARTEKAVLVHPGERGKAVWLPLSMIEMDPDDTVSGTAIMTLPESLALDKGLI